MKFKNLTDAVDALFDLGLVVEKIRLPKEDIQELYKEKKWELPTDLDTLPPHSEIERRRGFGIYLTPRSDITFECWKREDYK